MTSDIVSRLVERANERGRQMLATLFADHLWGPPTALALESLGELAGQRVIELGCGRGEISVILALLGATVRAFDIDEQRLATARALAVECGVAERCEFALGHSESVRLPDAGADVVWSRTSLQYTDRHAVLAECKRLLVPGGRLILVENLPNNPFVMAYRSIRRLRAHTASSRAYVASIKGYLQLDEVAELRAAFEALDVRVFHLIATLTAFVPPHRGRRIKALMQQFDANLLERCPRLEAAAWIVVVRAIRR